MYNSFMDINESTRDWVKKNKSEICSRIANIEEFPPVEGIPDSFFMAGSPGAGKTEWSISFIKTLCGENPSRRIVRIDPDELRAMLPDYDPTIAEKFQSGTNLAVEKLIDHVIKNKQDFLLDGTFAHYDSSYKNIKRCLQESRRVGILYIYQDPKVAWEFTKKRSAVEKRTIPKEAFIHAYFNAKNNVNMIKKEFGSDVEIWLVLKNFQQKVSKTWFNVSSLDPYVKMTYNPKTLERALL